MYTLMRCNHRQIEREIVLDLYDLKNKKGVELHYSLYHKNIDTSLLAILDELVYKTLELNAWNNIVQQFIENK